MKQFKITVNGKSYDVAVEETGSTASTPVAQAAAPAAAGSEKINSPMPGNILDIKVSAGDTVKTGDTLVVLEAMKMENEIKAPCDGTVAGVHVNKGDTVDSGALLISLN